MATIGKINKNIQIAELGTLAQAIGARYDENAAKIGEDRILSALMVQEKKESTALISAMNRTKSASSLVEKDNARDEAISALFDMAKAYTLLGTASQKPTAVKVCSLLDKYKGIAHLNNATESAKIASLLEDLDKEGNKEAVEELPNLAEAVAALRAYQASGATRPLAARRSALLDLRAWLRAHEDDVLAALAADLGKSPFEGYATELGMVYDEIRVQLAGMAKWSRPRRVRTPLVHAPSSSTILQEPYGVVLIMSPWNYPLQLALIPLVDAIAAGNCVGLKPSRTSTHTSALLARLVEEVFNPGHVRLFPGSQAMNDLLLAERWDLLFFTGSPRVAHTIMAAAAAHLTPCVLELGGKSPCIVDASANVTRAAQRIAWGKGINSGQTCVAPDYFLVHEDVEARFVEALRAAFAAYYGENALVSEEWPHMINRRHFDRVMGLIEHRGPGARVAFGGEGDPETLRIQPTCLVGVTREDPVMAEEIFGPVCPVVTYRTLEEAIAFIHSYEKPLACYVFAESREVQRRVLAEVSSGGACINDVVIHLANPRMPFGGVGNSGMGAYHGEAGFHAFSHSKSTMKKGTWLEIPFRNPPFGNRIDLLRRIMR